MSKIEQRLRERSSNILENLNEFEDIIEIFSKEIFKTLNNGNKLLFCGNGGSAAESQHMAAEYCATLNHHNPRKGFKAMALTVDTSFITAWSNDFGFEGIFERQIETLGEENDMLICYSTSGSSKNIIKGALEAKRKKMHVLAFTGNSQENKLVDIADYSFIAPSSKTAMIQEMHTIIGHEVCLSVEKSLAID
jgi:D-sedoheptulose 7-phosphate isomerase|tara:strand:- start:214 stop:792 length:579 start_codon:yes stop_codon:yes gene_type:complete